MNAKIVTLLAIVAFSMVALPAVEAGPVDDVQEQVDEVEGFLEGECMENPVQLRPQDPGYIC